MNYHCPDCDRKLLEADAPLVATVTLKCRRCMEIVEPVPRGEVMHRVYECSGCHTKHYLERPDRERSFCAVCGTESLEVARERRRAPQTVRVRA